MEPFDSGSSHATSVARPCTICHRHHAASLWHGQVKIEGRARVSAASGVSGEAWHDPGIREAGDGIISTFSALSTMLVPLLSSS